MAWIKINSRDNIIHMDKNLKIVFLGTPEFAIKPLEALMKESYQITGVITAPDMR